MKHRFISFLLSLLLLISAQGAFAARYFYSKVTPLTPADFVDATKWSGSVTTAASCPTSGTAGTGTTTLAADDVFTICDTHTMNVAANATLATLDGTGKLVIDTGGTLSIAAGAKLTTATAISTAGTGKITIADTGELAGATLTTAGSGTVTGTKTGKVTLSGKLVIGTGTEVAIGVGGVFTAAGASTITGTGKLTIADTGNLALGTGTLALSGTGMTITTAGTGKITTTDTTSGLSVPASAVLAIGAGNTLNIAGLVTTAGSGEITIADGGKLAAGSLTTAGTKGVTVTGSGQIVLTGALTVGNATTIALGTSGALEVGGTAIVWEATTPTGKVTGGTVSLKGALTTYNGGITGIVKPITTGQSYTFKDATTLASFDLSGLSVGNTFLTVTSTLALTNILNGTIECPTGAAYAGGTATIASGTTCTVKTRPTTVFAPLFSTKEKAKVFVEEVNH